MRVRWSSGSARWHSETIGPWHDPCGRDVIEISTRGHEFKLVSCGLAGEYLVKDGEKIIELPLYYGHDEKGRELAIREFNAAVEMETGFEPYFWNYRLVSKIERHRSDEEILAEYHDARLLSHAL
jgi:hypothetical protein